MNKEILNQLLQELTLSCENAGRESTAARQALSLYIEELENLALVASKTTDIIVKTDASGFITYVNNAYESLTGYTFSEVIGKRPGALVQGPETDPETKNRIRQAIMDRKTIHEEILNYTKSKQKYWQSITVDPVFNQNGECIAFVSINKDITERKRKEEELKRVQEFLIQTNKVSRVGGWNLDLPENKLTWSEITREIHEVDPDYEPDLETAISFYKPGKNRDIIQKALKEATLDGKPYNIDLQMVTAKGNSVWVRAVGNTESKNGVCTRVYGTFQDITEQKKTEIEIRRKENMLRAIAHSTDELLSNPDILDAIKNSLPILGQAVGVDRVYLFQNNYDDENKPVTSQRLEWNSGVADPQIDNPELQSLPIEIFDVFLKDLYQKKPFHAIIAQLPPGSEIKEILEAQDIQSVLIIPIFCDDLFWGFVGYDECKYQRKWAEDEVSILKSFSNSISSAIERSRIDAELERLSLVARSNRQGVHFTGPDLKINYTNEALLKLTGYDLDEVLGKTPPELFHGPLTQIESVAALEKGHRLIEPVDIDIILYRKDRSWFWANVKKQPLQKKENEAQEFFSIIEDITEKKNQEKTLIQQEEKYRNIIANMKMGLVETDNEDTIHYVNQQFCEMSGYSREEILGKKSIDLLVGEEFTKIVREKNSLRLDGISDIYQTRIKIKNGDLRWWLTSGGPNFNDKGKLVGTVGISVDVTDQKILEQELEIARKKAEESSNAKEAFLANMSHEIRTPLNAIIGLIREMSLESLSPKQILYIKNAGLASQHLLSIVNDILDISKIESGQLQLDLHPFDLSEVINEAVSILTPAAREKKLKFSSGISLLLAPAYLGDSIRIRQILLNIINNAIKFTEEGSISVECEVTGISNNVHSIQIIVSDTGIGMEESFVKNIFDKFSQGDYSTARRYGGTGLGMAITYELIQMMKGSIIVSSKKDVGTTIEINLDLKTGNEKEIDHMVTPESYDMLKNKKILLVEDNDLNRLVALNSLNHYDLNVTEAANGVEALEKIKDESFDLILMDLQMPFMGGIEATTIIRREMGLNTPIIALTANAFKAEMDNCLAAGMNDYITKPFEENTLLRVIFRNLSLSTDSGIVVEDKTELSPRLYNLDKLMEFSDLNSDFIQQMIQVFIEQTPIAIDQIKTAWMAGDLETVRQVAHSIKPNIDYFGIVGLKNEIRAIESLAKEGLSNSELETAIDRVEEVIKEVVRELKDEYW